jgi:hypothetical protein
MTRELPPVNFSLDSCNENLRGERIHRNCALMLSGVPGAVLDMPSLLGFAALDSVGALLTRGNDSTICRNEFFA